MAKITEINETNRLPCGHPRGCLVQDTEGTAHCAWCEEVARLREELERLRGDDGHPHESGDECMSCERLATKSAWPWCNQCLLEHQLQDCNEVATKAMTEEVRLRMVLEQNGAAHLPCQHCGKNIATPTLESVELCFECWERLRELIPDAGMLNWLVKAAHRWWKDNGGEGMQEDIVAGYALVKKLYGEANVDKK